MRVIPRDLVLAAASLSRRRNILASRFQDLPLTAETLDNERIAAITTNVRMTLHVPGKTETVRVVTETAERGRAGSLEISRAQIEASRDTPTPAPRLVPRPPTSR